MIVVPTEQKGFDAIESLIGQPIGWLNDEAVEWDAKAGRRGRGKPADKKSKGKPTAKTKDLETSNDAPVQNKQQNEAPKRNAKQGRKPYHEQTDLEYTDTDHAFGGEEHIPAFLR